MWALEQAKRNLAEHYLVVGVMEELTDFISILETALPRFFRGATSHFLSSKSLFPASLISYNICPRQGLN